MDRRRSAAVFFIAMGILILVLVAVSIAGSRKTDDGGTEASSVAGCLPDAAVREVSDSKREAIMEGRSARQTRVEAYYDSCALAQKDTLVKNEDPLRSIGGDVSRDASSEGRSSATSSDLFGSSVALPSSEVSREKISRESPAQREARHQKRREEAIDLANEISGNRGSSAQESDAPERIDLSMPESQTMGRGGIISSLGGTGVGVNSLERPPGTFSTDSDHPFRCMFPRQEKLRSGQRVSVRLLEDMMVSSYIIPKNTHLQGYVTIDARLEIEIASIEIGGHLLPLGCVAFDTDGVRGIYCPEAGEAKRTLKTSGLSTVGSFVGGRVGRLASEVVNTGVAIAQSSSGERTVTVPAGYNFFIVRKKQP